MGNILEQYAIFYRQNVPVGVVIFENLVEIGVVIDFYGFREAHPLNIRSLFALLKVATGAKQVCGVKEEKLIKHLKKLVPEIEIEQIFSHSRIQYVSGETKNAN